jgi:hypothetical protein
MPDFITEPPAAMNNRISLAIQSVNTVLLTLVLLVMLSILRHLPQIPSIQTVQVINDLEISKDSLPLQIKGDVKVTDSRRSKHL